MGPLCCTYTKGFDVSKFLFDIVLNSKIRFMTCKGVFLFGLKYTDSSSAAEWSSRSVENYTTLSLPDTYEELQQVPLDRVYNFLMSLAKNSIDKDIERLGVEALMFWELPKVENALNDMCQAWFINDYSTFAKGTTDSSEKQNTPSL